MPEHIHLIRRWVEGGTTNPEVCALGKIVGSYNTFAAEVFPQRAKSVRGSEIAFLMKRLEMRSELYE